MEILGTTSWCMPFHSSNFGQILMNYLNWFYRSTEHEEGAEFLQYFSRETLEKETTNRLRNRWEHKICNRNMCYNTYD
jgi:hypothetical protein